MDLLYRVKVYTITGIYNGALMRACLCEHVVPLVRQLREHIGWNGKRFADNILHSEDQIAG